MIPGSGVASARELNIGIWESETSVLHAGLRSLVLKCSCDYCEGFYFDLSCPWSRFGRTLLHGFDYDAFRRNTKSGVFFFSLSNVTRLRLVKDFWTGAATLLVRMWSFLLACLCF